MSKRLILGVLLTVMVLSTAVAVRALYGGGGSGHAQGETVEMGIDPNVTGNTASTLGTLEDCAQVDVPSPAFDGVSDYNIDVYVLGDTQEPIAYDAWVTYDASKVHVAAPGTSSLIKLPGASSFGDARPDTDGKFVAGAAYLSDGAGIAGDGALLRLGLDIGGSGLVTFGFDPAAPAAGYASAGGSHAVTRRTAQLAINEDCPPGGRAEPSPTPAPTSTAPTEGLEGRRLEEERLRLEDEAKPRFEGVVNGIHIYPTNAAVPERKWACTDAKPEEVQHVDMSAIAGTPMQIVPTYLPPGAEESLTTFPPAVCKGTVAYVEREWVIRDKGAEVFIARREGERAINWDAPAERISAVTVAGKPAVLVKPVLEGYDYSAVILAEEFGITVVRVFALPLDEAQKIAEGLK